MIQPQLVRGAGRCREGPGYSRSVKGLEYPVSPAVSCCRRRDVKIVDEMLFTEEIRQRASFTNDSRVWASTVLRAAGCLLPFIEHLQTSTTRISQTIAVFILTSVCATSCKIGTIALGQSRCRRRVLRFFVNWRLIRSMRSIG